MAADTEMVLLGLVEKAKRDELLTAQTLPKTTNSDNGKVLMVVNGEWTIADLPSGGK